MEHLVLVTYATRFGSTSETAQEVAETLRARGLAVDFQPIKRVASVERYDAVVLGAALYIGRLHKDARRFLSAQQIAFAKIPIALFVPGPVGMREKDWTGAKHQLDVELDRIPWLAPIARQIVGGKFDPRSLGFAYRLIPALRKIPPSDARDWTAIRTWANDLAGKLPPVMHQ
jgi:menaquinone-dependent protoporphyrinogen oxidase